MPVAARFEKVVVEQGQRAVVQLPANSGERARLGRAQTPARPDGP